MRHPCHRHGWSLLELLVVIPLMTLLMSGSAMLLTSLFRSQETLRSELQQQSGQARLATQLRADAHSANSVTSRSPQTCEFALAGGDTIHYEIKGDSLHRELRHASEPPASDPAARESYSLDGFSAAFNVDPARERPLVRLKLTAVPEETKFPRTNHSTAIEAAVGIHPMLTAGRAQP